MIYWGQSLECPLCEFSSPFFNFEDKSEKNIYLDNLYLEIKALGFSRYNVIIKKKKKKKILIIPQNIHKPHKPLPKLIIYVLCLEKNTVLVTYVYHNSSKYSGNLITYKHIFFKKLKKSILLPVDAELVTSSTEPDQISSATGSELDWLCLLRPVCLNT